MNEKEVQAFIAKNPWLLNINYEAVPGLPRRGQEVRLAGAVRIDLLLKERITNRPVVVEVKAVPFYRENIGQLLEYRARIIGELQVDDSELTRYFGEHIVSPILVLVVPRCDEFSQIACQLSGISIYQYQGAPAKWMLPKAQQSLEAFGRDLARSVLPLNDERNAVLQNIDAQILELLSEFKAEAGFLKYRRSKDVYYWGLDNCFLNKWLFPGEVVSMGIYEDVMHQDFRNVTIEYCSGEQDALLNFQKRIMESGLKAKVQVNEDHDEWHISFHEPKRVFLESVATTLAPYVKAYLKYFRPSL